MSSYDLTLAAEEDLRGIWRYTYETWGADQAEKYLDQIEACCTAILGIGFTEKVEIARHLLPAALGAGFKVSLLDFVAPFRNDVAHGLPFERVENVPSRIRQIDALIQHLGDPRITARS